MGCEALLFYTLDTSKAVYASSEEKNKALSVSEFLRFLKAQGVRAPELSDMLRKCCPEVPQLLLGDVDTYTMKPAETRQFGFRQGDS